MAGDTFHSQLTSFRECGRMEIISQYNHFDHPPTDTTRQNVMVFFLKAIKVMLAINQPSFV